MKEQIRIRRKNTGPLNMFVSIVQLKAMFKKESGKANYHYIL